MRSTASIVHHFIALYFFLVQEIGRDEHNQPKKKSLIFRIVSLYNTTLKNIEKLVSQPNQCQLKMCHFNVKFYLGFRLAMLCIKTT